MPSATPSDIHAAKLYLQGAGPWKLDEIGIGPDDYLVQCFARYRAEIIEQCVAALIKQVIGKAIDRDGATHNNALDDAIDAIRALAGKPDAFDKWADGLG